MLFSNKYGDHKTITFYLALSRFLGYKQQSKLRIFTGNFDRENPLLALFAMHRILQVVRT
jgi:hypothetical protein